jgi:hypothetical protein
VSKKAVAIIWFGTIALAILFDVFLATDDVSQNTWSAVTLDAGFRHPMIAVMTCVLPTHFFVPIFYLGKKWLRVAMIAVASTVVAGGIILDLCGVLPLWFFGAPVQYGLILYCVAGLGLGLLWPQPLPKEFRDEDFHT